MMFTVLEHIARHSREYNFSSRVALAGDSVGGNMATVLAMMAKKKGFPEIACQLLYYPVTDAAMDTDSYLDFAEGPWADGEGDGMVLGRLSAGYGASQRGLCLAVERDG